MKMTITPVKYSELKEGDLFSLHDEDDWGSILSDSALTCYDVHVRSGNPLKDWINTNYIVYKITL